MLNKNQFFSFKKKFIFKNGSIINLKLLKNIKNYKMNSTFLFFNYNNDLNPFIFFSKKKKI